MTYKANISFAGVITMRKGEVRGLPNIEAVPELLRCGYISEVKSEVSTDEAERSDDRKRKKSVKDRL